MDKNLNFLTKPLVDEAVIEINKNGIPPKREGRGYAISIGEEKYPFKLIVTEAAKISGINLTSNDFSSSEPNRNGFQKITGYPIFNLGADLEYLKFKKLVEYFIAHLEWLVTKDVNNRGYNEFIKPLIVNNSFKRTGQGYAEAQIQRQIKEWEQYENGKICINIQPNFGSYKSSKTYLNWQGTGLNIIANWDGNQISSLYQEEYLYWEKNPRRIRFGNEVSIEKLDLFNIANHVSETLIEFYETFNAAIIRYNKSEKLKKMRLAIDTSVNLLNYKKQIILQGPPGTGKTKLAKEIAEFFVFPNKDIDILYFKNTVLTLKSFKSRINYNSIVIESVKDEMIYFEGTRSVPKYSFSVNELYDCYIKKDYLGSNFVEYPQYSKRSLVWNIVDTFHTSIMDDQCKLIQFHPSYTYEDFVRGIVADSKGDRIEYKNVNKTLGLFAENALRNYKASNNVSSATNIDTWIDSKFEEFKNDIEAKLPEEETVLSGDITIFEVTDTYFKYAKTWQTPGYLKFTEFKKLVKAIILGDLELSNRQLDKEKFIHAHYRYTYYNALLSKFFENYKYLGESYSEPPKNYVLIIDEINRANLSSVLGELIYALEYRGEAVESMYAVEDDNKLILPPNLYIVGTMNTADRSVGHIDYAIRRRFAFVDVLPKDLSEEEGITFDSAIFSEVAQLFETNLSAEFEKKDVQLGHSYFIDKSDEEDGAPMTIRLEYEIKPILLEYVKDGVLIGDDIKQKIKDLKTSI